MIASWEDGKVPRYEVVGSHAQYFTWNVPAIKKARYIKRINGKLRTKIRMMKRQIEDLQIQLSKPGGMSQHKRIGQ